jgi:hypothetical protein
MSQQAAEIQACSRASHLCVRRAAARESSHHQTDGIAKIRAAPKNIYFIAKMPARPSDKTDRAS